MQATPPKERQRQIESDGFAGVRPGSGAAQARVPVAGDKRSPNKASERTVKQCGYRGRQGPAAQLIR
jgi:hypothetical protein